MEADVSRLNEKLADAESQIRRLTNDMAMFQLMFQGMSLQSINIPSLSTGVRLLYGIIAQPLGLDTSGDGMSGDTIAVVVVDNGEFKTGNFYIDGVLTAI